MPGAAPPLHLVLLRAVLLGGGAGLCGWLGFLALAALVRARGEPDPAAGLVPAVAVVQVATGAGWVLAQDLSRPLRRAAGIPLFLGLLLLVRLGLRPLVVTTRELGQDGALDPRVAWARATEVTTTLVEWRYPGYTLTWVSFVILALVGLLRLAPRRAPAWLQVLAVLTLAWAANPLFQAVADPARRPGFHALARCTWFGALPVLVGALALSERVLAGRASPLLRALGGPRPGRSRPPPWAAWPLVLLFGAGLWEERRLRDLELFLAQGDDSAGRLLLEAGQTRRVVRCAAEAPLMGRFSAAKALLLAEDEHTSARLLREAFTVPGEELKLVNALNQVDEERWAGPWGPLHELLLCSSVRLVREGRNSPYTAWHQLGVDRPARVREALAGSEDPRAVREALRGLFVALRPAEVPAESLALVGLEPAPR